MITVMATLLVVNFYASSGDLPNTPKKPVTDNYHGISVVDDYRWLENANSNETKRWVRQQNEYARHILDG